MSVSWATCGSWLLHSAAAGGVLLLLTFGLARFVRQPARKQRLCEYGVMAAVIAAVLNLLLPGWLLVPHAGGNSLARGVSVPVGLALDPLPEPGPRPLVAHRPGAPVPGPVLEVKKAPEPDSPAEGPGVEEPVPSLAATVLDWSGTWLPPGLAVAHAAGAVLFLLYLLLGHAALLRLLARSRPAPAAVVELFRAMHGPGRPPRLLVTDRVRVPFSCGLLRPTVLVPANLCDPAAARKLRWIFAHELTHLRRRDAWSCLLFCVGQALYFYVPWFWWLRRQARLCQEFVADAVAALEEVPPVSYAEFLVSLTRAPAVPMAATGVAGRPSDLFRRVSMLLQNPLSVERDCPRRWSLLAAGSLLGLAVVLSGVSLTAQPAGAQEKVIIRKAPGDEPKDIVVHGQSPVKITIHIEAGDKKEPVIRKDEKVKVLVVPDDKGDKKGDHIFYWTPRVIIEQKGDKKGDMFWYRLAPDGKAKETPEGPARKGKGEVEKKTGAAPKKAAGDVIYEIYRKQGDGNLKYKVIQVPHDIHLWDVKEGKALHVPQDERLWKTTQDGKVQVWVHKQVEPNLEKVRKALEKLEKIPNVDDEQIRREVMKALEQLHKAQPRDGNMRWEFHYAPDQKTIEKKQIERKQSENQSEKKAVAAWVEEVRPEKVEIRSNLLNALRHQTGQPGRLGIHVEVPGEVLADQLNLPKGKGLVVLKVAPQSPADKAGLKSGDVLLKIKGEPVPADGQHFIVLVTKLPGDQDVDAVVIRKGKPHVIRGIHLGGAAAPQRSGGDAKEPEQAAVELGLKYLQGQPKHNLPLKEVIELRREQGQPKILTEVVPQHLLQAKTLAAPQKAPAKDGVLTTTFRKGTRYTTRHQEGSLILTVVGDVANRDALEISVQDGKTAHTYNRINQVPAAYRDKVSHLIEISSHGAGELPR